MDGEAFFLHDRKEKVKDRIEKVTDRSLNLIDSDLKIDNLFILTQLFCLP